MRAITVDKFARRAREIPTGAVGHCSQPAAAPSLDTNRANLPTPPGGRSIFTVHYLDHPHSGETRVLDGWSYFWGAIGGPLFLLFKGFGRAAAMMVGVTLAIVAGGAAAAALVAVATDAPELIFVAWFVIIVIAIIAQAACAVELLRRCYLELGYREGYY